MKLFIKPSKEKILKEFPSIDIILFNSLIKELKQISFPKYTFSNLSNS